MRNFKKKNEIKIKRLFIAISWLAIREIKAFKSVFYHKLLKWKTQKKKLNQKIQTE